MRRDKPEIFKMNGTRKIEFIDLAAQQARIRDRLDAAIARVLDHGAYIMGPEVDAFEKQLAAFCGARNAIGCSNGTDAIVLCLMAKGLQPGDVVFCPSFTFAATAEAVAFLGGRVVFVDIDPDTYNMDVESLKTAIRETREQGLSPKGVIAVDLFGQPADYDSLLPVAREAGLWLLCDAAQSFGATYRERKVGTLADMTTTSFFPAKPLGAYGDGGAVFVEDDEVAEIIRSTLVHGKGREKYDNVRVGMNGRLDTIQAAVLIEKLRIFAEEIELRNRVAARYCAALADHVCIPRVPDGLLSVWAQFTVRVPGARRAEIQAALKQSGVPTAIYYPKPLHRQTAFAHFPVSGNGLPNSDAAAQEVLSLPMHPYLDEATQDYIVERVKAAL
ncbi:MAG: DegT/DnrJ/EryC1/StrS family aminotransferase [Kiloniellaceae bacterium]